MRFFKYFSIAILILATILYWQSRQGQYQQLRGYIFGTYYSIKVRSETPVKDFAKIIDEQFNLVNQQMSVFVADSIINNLNDAQKNQWLIIPPELYLVLQSSDKIYRQSLGAFDPTVGNLVNLWGFGPDGRRNTPNPQEIKNVMAHLGFNKIRLRTPDKVSKTDRLTQIDLSAIAKGYAVDLIAQTLRQRGYGDFLVDIGGEVYASGNRSQREHGWNIGIAEPSEKGHKNLLSVGLKDMAAATSGNYHNFYYQDGKKISHTIDPITGYPAEHNLVSATVFNESCMMADAYATALMSMGEEKGMAFANKYQLPVILFVKDSLGMIKTLYSKQAQIFLGV